MMSFLLCTWSKTIPAMFAIDAVVTFSRVLMLFLKVVVVDVVVVVVVVNGVVALLLIWKLTIIGSV